MGIDPDQYAGKPVIGIANSWSELNNCNMNLRELAEAVKRGVIAAGGLQRATAGEPKPEGCQQYSRNRSDCHHPRSLTFRRRQVGA